MGTVQYRVELNSLTKPASYKLRFIPQQIAGYDELAAAVAKDNGLTTEQAKAFLQSTVKNIKEMLCNGIQVTLAEAFTFCPSFHARLNNPDDPLPPINELLRISISATRPFVQAVQQAVTLECLPPEEKAPVILSATDTALELHDVLNSEGVLRLTGSNLSFDKNKPDCGCTIEGTHDGQIVQSQFAKISDTEILLVPHIPMQEYLWNNEYTLSVSTQYTEHGTIRSSTYGRKLRSPLVLTGFSTPSPTEVGILTGNTNAAYVKATAAQMSASERLRIQADFSQQEEQLSFRLIALRDGGAVGGMVPVTGNGEYTLPGFAGSAVSSLTVQVDSYAGLVALIRSSYNGRLVDILDMTM